MDTLRSVVAGLLLIVFFVCLGGALWIAWKNWIVPEDPESPFAGGESPEARRAVVQLTSLLALGLIAGTLATALSR